MDLRTNGIYIDLERLYLRPSEIASAFRERQEHNISETRPHQSDQEAICHFLDTLEHNFVFSGMEPADRKIFEDRSVRIRHLLSQDSFSHEEIRDELLQAGLACFVKHGPRVFAYDSFSRTKYAPDSESLRWSISFYKMERAKEGLAFLRGKNILEPCAGSCALALEAVTYLGCQSVVCGDICYDTSHPIFNNVYAYAPLMNLRMFDLFFSVLPRWAQPRALDKIKGVVSHDARQLSFKDGQFDYVLSDPPFGISCPVNGPTILADIIQESLRVATGGAVMLVLQEWKHDIEKFCSQRGFTARYVTPNLANEGKRAMAYMHFQKS